MDEGGRATSKRSPAHFCVSPSLSSANQKVLTPSSSMRCITQPRLLRLLYDVVYESSELRLKRFESLLLLLSGHARVLPRRRQRPRGAATKERGETDGDALPSELSQIAELHPLRPDHRLIKAADRSKHQLLSPKRASQERTKDELVREAGVAEDGGVVGRESDRHSVVQQDRQRLRTQHQRQRPSQRGGRGGTYVRADAVGVTEELVADGTALDQHPRFSHLLHQDRMLDERQPALSSLPHQQPFPSPSSPSTHPCPIRFVPNRRASYKLLSASVPSPSVSPAWKMKGTSRERREHSERNQRKSSR